MNHLRPILSRVECPAKAIPLLGAVKLLESITDPSERLLASFAGIPIHVNELLPENMAMMIYSDHTDDDPHFVLVRL
jgi:hypothetical protein